MRAAIVKKGEACRIVEVHQTGNADVGSSSHQCNARSKKMLVALLMANLMVAITNVVNPKYYNL
jgi:hypothetical protein